MHLSRRSFWVAVGLAVAVLLRAMPAWADEPVHIVQPVENVFRIALNHGVAQDALRAANGLNGNLIYAGQALTIPGVSAPATNPPPALTAQPAAPPSTGLVHVVQPGETLFRIGLRYNLSWTSLQRANGLSGDRVFAGQRLTIPMGEAVAAVVDAAPVATPSPASPSSGAPSGSGKRFLVDLSEQRLYAYEGDMLVRTTLVSTGLPATPTVTGSFYIYLRLPSQRMRGPGYDLPNVPYVQYFYKGYGLHGTYWHNNFGTPMSHGCVNMPSEEAEWAYNWADYGTPVIVQP